MTQEPRNADQVIERIRQLNEQVLATGRKAGLGFLESHEQTMELFIELPTKVVVAADIELLNSVARLQATFARDVLRASTGAAGHAVSIASGDQSLTTDCAGRSRMTSGSERLR